jgi:RND family efflux transporter MFP subunit
VTVAAARTATLRDLAVGPGTIVPAVAGDYTVTAPAPGKVAELHVKEGDAVKAGDVLVRFDVAAWTQQLDAREQAMAEASAQVERSRTEAARLEDLFNRGLMPRNSLEAARGTVGSAEAALNQARTEVDLARLEQSRSEIKARFAGTVQKVWHAEGDFVSGEVTDPVLRVVDPTRIQAAVQLPPAQLARVTPGQAATIRAVADGLDHPATVAQKQAVLDAMAPTGEVRVAFAEPTPPVLPLDSPVSVEIVLDQRSGVLVIPAAAVQHGEAGQSVFVMVAGDDGRAHHREIRTGLVTKDEAQIMAGLTAGERVIVAGTGDVAEGTPIVVSP